MLFWLVAGLSLQDNALGQSAQLTIEPSEYDFGKIFSTRIVRYTFLLRNTGTATLYIRDLTTT